MPAGFGAVPAVLLAEQSGAIGNRAARKSHNLGRKVSDPVGPENDDHLARIIAAVDRVIVLGASLEAAEISPGPVSPLSDHRGRRRDVQHRPAREVPPSKTSADASPILSWSLA
jgi:hypothetical protein